MAQRNLGAPQFPRFPEKDRPPQPRAKEAGIFAILLPVRPRTVVGAYDFITETLIPEENLQLIGRLRVETRIDVNGEKLVADRNAPEPFTKEPEQKHTVLAPRDPDRDFVTVSYQSVMVNPFSQKPPNFLIRKRHDCPFSSFEF
jgi:hypothetical protein